MKKLILVAAGLALIATPVFAGEYLMNDTGQTVYGLTVAFSEPVTITGFGDVLMTVEPTGESTSFTFSGGELDAWGGQWLNWEPTSSLLVRIEWKVDPSSVPFPTAAEQCHHSEFTASKEVLEAVFAGQDGGEETIEIERYVESQCVPFAVKYRLVAALPVGSTVSWTATETDTSPHHDSREPLVLESEDLSNAVIVFFSNYVSYLVTARLNREDGARLTWTEVIQQQLAVGQAVRLGSAKWHPDYEWSQATGERNTMAYASGIKVQIANDEGRQCFLPQWPGNYVFTTCSDSGCTDATRIEVLVSSMEARSLDILGVFYTDHYGLYPPGNRVIDESVIHSAFQYAKDLGANTVAVNNFAGFVQIDPLPLLRLDEHGPSISMTTLRSVAETSDALGLDLYLSLAIFDLYPYLSDHEKAVYWDPSKSSAWYSRYFEELTRFVDYNIDASDGFGIEYISPIEHAGPIYLGNNYYSQRIPGRAEALIEHMQASFQGSVGWADPHEERSNTFLQAADFVVIRLWPMERFRDSTFPDSSNPTIEQIRRAAIDYFNSIRRSLPNDVPVYVHVSALSEDRQHGFMYSEPFPKENMDLQEQVHYLEGFFQAIYETEWIDGVYVWNVNWFPEWAVDEWETTYSNWNVRGKPAEAVVRLWFNIFGGAS